MRTAATRSLISLGVLILLLGTKAQADPIVIDFEDGTLGSAIGSFYAGQGVTFSNAQFVNALGVGFQPPSSLGFSALSGPGPSNPIIISFATLQSQLTLTAVDLSGQGFLLKVFSATGSFLGQVGSLGGDTVGIPITFSVDFANPTISFVELFQPNNISGTSGGVVFDNLRIDTTGVPEVPEPATLILLGSGLGGAALGAYGRRKAHRTG